MPTTAAGSSEDVLHATDTALRLVHQALGDLSGDVGRGGCGSAVASETGGGSLLGLASTLLKAYSEVAALLSRVRESRGLLQEASVVRLEQMNRRLSQVTSATEQAATGMLDGIDRAMAVVSELEEEAAAEGDAIRGVRYAALREELYNVMAHIQFQDITSQQLGYASAVITETEQRLEQLTSLFSPFVPEQEHPPAALDAPSHFDPNAVVDKADSQAFADALFGRR